MILGAHIIVYSKHSDVDRAFFQDVLGLGHVDVGGGWLIFGLPPAELAVHPGESNDVHELYLMCDDVEAFVARMAEHGIACTAIQNQGWGMLTSVTLPGGGKLGVYQPRHASPKPTPARSAKKSVRPKTRTKPKAKPKTKTKTKTKRPTSKTKRRA